MAAVLPEVDPSPQAPAREKCRAWLNVGARLIPAQDYGVPRALVISYLL